MRLLKTLVELRRKSYNELIDMDDLCEKLYGKKYMQYNHFPYIKDYPNLQFLLLSLKQSEDIHFTEEVLIRDLKVLPKAIETLSKYEIDMSKHIDSYKITKWQLWVAIVMALLAISNLVLAYFHLRAVN